MPSLSVVKKIMEWSGEKKSGVVKKRVGWSGEFMHFKVVIPCITHMYPHTLSLSLTHTHTHTPFAHTRPPTLHPHTNTHEHTPQPFTFPHPSHTHTHTHLHCFPMRPLSSCAIEDHFFAPYLPTSSTTLASSCVIVIVL